MGLLILLTSTLLSGYFHPMRVVDAQRAFTIGEITLNIEPSTNVMRDTNVTLQCRSVVSSTGNVVLSREYTIYKGDNIIYTKTATEDFLYPLHEARVSNSGKYKCVIKIENTQKSSEAKKLTVSGLSKPVLRLNKGVVKEGEEITATCTAPGETGSFYFYFYEDSKEIKERQVNSNQAEAKFRFSSGGIHKIHCSYIVLISPDSVKSEESNTVTISVKELPITVVLDIVPEYKVYEGDQLDISCTIDNFQHSDESFNLLLIQGTHILSSGNTSVNHSMFAQAEDPGVFECKLEMRNVVKNATKTISVTELFSVPTLTVSPAEVFLKENMRLTCESYASERISKDQLTYTLDPPQIQLNPISNGVFSGWSLSYDFNYTCLAEAKGIMKRSKTLTVRPKTFVSHPKISVEGKAVLGQPVNILCQSDYGSLPINYTLFKGYKPLSKISIKLPSQLARFTVNITRPEDIREYMCEAQNSHKRDPLLGNRLNAAVIVPLSTADLIVIPDPRDISEGASLYLICRVDGTPPVTFKWYRVGSSLPLHTNISNLNSSDYQVPSLSKVHSGRYYCEAYNRANKVVRSEPVEIEVHMALWKKALIGGVCLLAVLVLVVVCVLRFRSKRVIVDRSATVSVWSKRPPEEDVANDEESSMATKEPDVEYTEVVHPRPVDPARVPLRKGTDTVYSELQNSPHGPADYHDYHGSVEYAELNGEQPEINHYYPEVNNFQDLPMPVD